MTHYDNNQYSAFRPDNGSYFLLLVLLIGVMLLGAYAAITMEHAGHAITGMNNHIVWGLPHVFAVSLIVTASGALNGASLASVFNLQYHKPYARISVVLAATLLVGGMLVLVLDLGRPDRLIVAMTTYNFRSIFSWNIFLYTGFLGICVLYLWMMLERRMNRHVVRVGRFAFAWRIILTTGTGSIFGFLVGRNSLDSALLAPLFIALSLAMGTACQALILIMLDRWRTGMLDGQVVASMRRLLLWFVLALVYLSVVHHITNLYVAEHLQSERELLAGSVSPVFWFGHIIVGTVIPVALLLLKPDGRATSSVAASSFVWACISTLIGGMALIYVIIIGSQSTPQRLFPGKTITASRFGDGGFAPYVPSLWEWGLGLGGIATGLLLSLVVLRILPLVPEHYRAASNNE